MSDIPEWDTSSLYLGFSDPRYEADQKTLTKTAAKILKILKRLPETKKGRRDEFARVVRLFEAASAQAEQLGSYAYMLYSVNTRDEEALRQMNRNEELLLPLHDAQVKFRAAWAASGVSTDKLLAAHPDLEPHRLSLDEDGVLAGHQLSAAEENLAADLARSGADAWGRLHSALSSTLTAVWDAKKKTAKTVTELRQLAYSPDRAERVRAFELEKAAWKSAETSFAAALNGVKGHAATLNRRRGWNGPLELSALQARLSPRALDSLIAVMDESLPLFRRYLKAKARWLKLPALGFCDLFAPVGSDERRFTWDEAKAYLVKNFAGFSPDFAEFTALAFGKKWIHARPLDGKVGGAYCTSLPLSREPRVLSNFDGSFGEVKTLAHELGHAWHFWLLRDKGHAYHEYPMTLAETASIFAETIVTEEALKDAAPDAALFILEQSLQDSTQVIVDILSRFRFEKAVFETRQTRELGAQEFNELMVAAQKSTYGDGLNADELHPWMWAVKGHYYSPGLAFYNYPYAFGQLFALALYGMSKQQGPSFVGVYEQLLGETGVRTADDLAAGAGFDLSSPSFWRQGMAAIENQVVEFERRTHGR
jgi:pepF/M3 family oligoendopeptidase